MLSILTLTVICRLTCNVGSQPEKHVYTLILALKNFFIVSLNLAIGNPQTLVLNKSLLSL